MPRWRTSKYSSAPRILFLVTGLFVGAAIIAWVSQKITRPIQALRQDAAIIGAGNLEHRTHVSTGDEIEELATEFNKMTIALQNSYATLEQKVEQRTKEISALYSVTTSVNESLALNDILNAIIAKTIEIFHFESIRVFLFNDERDALELRASFATNPEHRDCGSRAQARTMALSGVSLKPANQ